ncbi:rhodanese-like domain-containing protein [Aestuariibaculum sediminum]|uniref:Rhodanese-like domain-containing protein n=1 Tax=Aestuariibaculum sediminum TaxID=2770637 RepID=A0A8J6Q5D6_9FLAO|nr:rhodanese-like domain-containing protein [Aestuariibaculum sediminum]MBD0830583.1 rhodanese-like domain-containing protein [Aestuariibaculum sediminum]
MRRQIVIGYFMLLSMFGCNQLSTQKEFEVVSVEQAKHLLQKPKKIQLLDVRTPEEYAEGHLEGALNINYFSETFKDEAFKLDKNKKVLVYCKSGKRSSKSAIILKALGFSKIYSIEGGITAWKDARFECVK